MLAFVICLSLFTLLGVVLVCLGIVFLYTRIAMQSHNKEISQLENELLDSHAEILELEKKRSVLNAKVTGPNKLDLLQAWNHYSVCPNCC